MYSPIVIPFVVGCVEHSGFENYIKIVRMTRMKLDKKSKLKIKVGGMITIYTLQSFL